MSLQCLQLEFNYFWHTGTGSGSGTHLDALTEKDRDYLPFVSGKHLKGLLRHAFHRAEAWGWYDQSLPDGVAENWETLIFGSTNQEVARHLTLPGMLHVDDAILCSKERAWLNDSPELKPFLYQEVFSTAIETATGTAKKNSLRGIEVSLPVTLFSDLELIVTATESEHRLQQQTLLKLENPFFWLEPLLPLIDSVGAHRTRGLGEARLSIFDGRHKELS
ncbi:MAG: hypothetical protein IBX50_14375 [Marinospirillum sp.]|nr:hypothetical protein [Marinospirillum sp.]